MCPLSSHMSFIFVVLLLSVIKFLMCYAGTSLCDASDREYSCDCTFDSKNRTVFIEENDEYNASANNFVPALKSLQYCQGSFLCKPNFKSNQPSEILNIDNFIICFSDYSCLSNGGYEIASLRGFKDSCIKNTCMYLKELIEFNITNAVLEMEVYTCIRVGPQGLKAPYCLKPACKSFVAVEKLCVCNYEIRHCTCSSYCDNLFTNPSHKTYALFLSFGDIYITKDVRGSFFHWIILIVLCVGLTILLIIFCKLCKAALDPANCGNEAQNTEILRRILTTTLDSNAPPALNIAKDVSDAERGSPPPTYEQVLKDKCIEFKKSIA